jgi:hypothetical protein
LEVSVNGDNCQVARQTLWLKVRQVKRWGGLALVPDPIQRIEHLVKVQIAPGADRAQGCLDCII